MALKNADVVIAGGGVIGSAIAYFLALNGVEVVLLEKEGIGSGSSGACDGAVLMQSKKPGIHLKMAMESHKLLGELQGQLPVPFELEKNGGLIVIETEEERKLMEQHVKTQREAGLDVELIDEQQLRTLSPHLSPHLLSATYLSSESKINPMSLTLGFIRGAMQLGADIITGTRVLNIKTNGNQIVSVQTDNGEIETHTVVNAAGANAPEIGNMLDIDIPIRPKRGQLLVTEARPGLLKPCLLTASYIAAKHNSPSKNKNSGGLSIDQTHNGNLLLGSTRELVGYDKRNTADGLKQIASRAVRILPDLKEMMLIRAFAGLRPCTPDGLPILGKVEKIKGFIMAAGHEGDGIALSAITGKLISELIINGEPTVSLENFNLNRFSTDLI